MRMRFDFNEFGTPISVHVCGTCGREFTVCPADIGDEFGDGCTLPSCSTYDPERDVDKMLEEGVRAMRTDIPKEAADA